MEPIPTLAMKNPAESSLFVIAKQLLVEQTSAIWVEIIKAAGSTPRDPGAQMIVTRDAIFGTIGGGRLEWMVCEEARALIERGEVRKTVDIALGPEIGQCCGGKVTLEMSHLEQQNLPTLEKAGRREHKWMVQIHGAGHTGNALCKVLALLPFQTEIIDSRADALNALADPILKTHNPVPETSVKTAPADTAFVIFTHEHHLDFLIAAEALKRGDAAYVGMIGSKTKRAMFKSWLHENGYETRLAENLTSPIGSRQVKDKRPEIIAALVASELIQLFSYRK